MTPGAIRLEYKLKVGDRRLGRKSLRQGMIGGDLPWLAIHFLRRATAERTAIKLSRR